MSATPDPLPPPPPPSPPPTAPPPPPPPELTSPPGSHAPTVRSAPLRRVAGLGRAATVLVSSTAVLSVLSVVATRAVRDDARAFLDGDLDRDGFLEAVAPYAIFSLLPVLAVLAAAVVVMVWLYRVAGNLRALHRGTTWGPGWAVGGWFAPPLVPVIPLLVLREAWKASDPGVPIGGAWRDRPAPWYLVAWFVVYGPLQIAVQLAGLGDLGGFGGSERALAEQITGPIAVPVLAALVDVIAAALFVVIVRGIVDRHARLTGERG